MARYAAFMRGELQGYPTCDDAVPRPRAPLDDRRPAGTADRGTPFVGRGEELAALATALRAVRRGQPQVILVSGPAGVGKTALADRFLRSAGDVDVLRIGAQCGHTRAVAPWLDPAGCAEPPCPLGGPLPGTTPGTAHLLAHLDGREARDPLVLLVDDLQSTDPDSLRALLYALRRLITGQILAMLLTRDETGGPAASFRRLAAHPRGAVLQLGPLTVADVRALVARTGTVPRHLARQLHAHTRGDPSCLHAVLAELARHPDRRHATLPVPPEVEGWVGRTMDRCAPGTRRLVEAASALGARVPLSTAAALGDVDNPLDALDDAVHAGLLEARDEPGIRDIAFPHPLVQAAVYEQL
ncbi:MAG: AAA family ATPase, partial [Thermoleophilia bacterium]